MRPYFRNVGIGGTLGFLVIGVAFASFAYRNVDGSFPQPEVAALSIGLFCIGWCLLGGWLILAYFRYRLVVNHDEICQAGAFRRQRAPIAQIQELRWRCFPRDGSIRISGEFGVVVLDLGCIAEPEREEVISFLRETIDDSRQIGWAKFTERILEARGPSIEAMRRIQNWSAVVFNTFGIALFIAWCADFGLDCLVLSSLCIITGTYAVVRVEW